MFVKDSPSKSSRPDVIIEYKFPKGFRLKRRKKINLIAAGKPKSSTIQKSIHSIPTSTFDAKLSQKFSASCNSLSLNATEPESSKKITKLRPTPIKSACSSLSLNRPQSQLVEKPTSKVNCSCCACKTMTTRKGDIEFFEVEEIANWGSGILVLTKLINTKNVTKMVNYRYLKHIWVNDHEKASSSHGSR